MGEAAITESCGTEMAALPCAGQARVGCGPVGTVVETATPVVVVALRSVVVDVGEVVVVVLVPELAVAGLAPAVSPMITAAIPRSEMAPRHNFEASA